MDALAALIDGFGDDPVVTLGILGLAGGALVAFVLLGFARDRQDVRRRASEGVDAPAPSRPAGGPGKPERPKSFERLVSFLDANLSGDARQNRVLRLQLVQAGFYDPRAAAVYFAARLGFALALGAVGLLAVPLVLGPMTGATPWLWTGGLGIAGYFVPTLYLSRRLAGRVAQHRMGFPDFMDLMVVCAEAGLSMEAGIERIARELVEGYPSLAENLYMLSLEIRAGKTFTDAFERMGERLGIEEAKMLSTLLQQSAELGTSLSASLRVYSDEMRSKRLSRAEEKAYSLPAKLTVPLILFVFPVLIFVLMLPVVIRFSTANF
ncbi:MAG TPA: type II secretion system F family protein [Beijerinckiaceae bacterium]